MLPPELLQQREEKEEGGAEPKVSTPYQTQIAEDVDRQPPATRAFTAMSEA